MVGYTLSRFPKISETFILEELDAVESEGVRIDLCPLRRERTEFVHPKAESWVARAHFTNLMSPAILGAHVTLLARSPRRYVRTLWAALWGTP